MNLFIHISTLKIYLSSKRAENILRSPESPNCKGLGPVLKGVQLLNIYCDVLFYDLSFQL